MIVQRNYSPLTCMACAEGAGLAFDFTMAFQPIVNIQSRSIFGYEALVRGINQESAAEILDQVNDENRYRFDQVCRVKAIQLAARLGLQTFLSINFLPNAVYRPETCIRTTLEAAAKYNFPSDHIIFEVTEGERVTNHQHLIEIFQEYKRLGFKTAIDDFGAGYAGLNLLAEFQPDIVKIDMGLTRDIHTHKPRRAIVLGILKVCEELGCTVIAEGIEQPEELAVLHDAGVHLFQGYLFARPGFEHLPQPQF